MRIKKKVAWVWIEIPCDSSGMGSCDYDDFCQQWPIPGPECPTAYQENGIPCNCPFAIGKYNLPSSVVGYIGASSMPKWLEKGQYHIKAWLSEPDNEFALCLQFNMNIRPL